MATSCCSAPSYTPDRPIPARYRRALWIALAVNLVMFLVEVGAGWQAGSVSLVADAVDFFGNAGNYALSLFVLSMGLLAIAAARQLIVQARDELTTLEDSRAHA